MVFGGLINLLKSIFGFGAKDAGTLEEKESESEIRKDKLRIKEIKKSTNTQHVLGFLSKDIFNFFNILILRQSLLISK